jgi:hypothetical protein
MGRGFIVGNVVDSTGRPVAGAEVAVATIRGLDVNGRTISYAVPNMVVKPGFPPNQNRPTNTAGVFKIAFSWDSVNADNIARVAGQDPLEVKLIVFVGTANKIYEQFATKIPDSIEIIQAVKDGKLLLAGTPKDILDKLTPLLRDALDGKDLDSIPFTLLSTDLIMIFGIAMNLVF